MCHMLHHIVRYQLLPLWQARMEEHRVAMSYYRSRLKEAIEMTGNPHLYPSMIGIVSRSDAVPRNSKVWSNGSRIRGVKPTAELGHWVDITSSVRLIAEPLWKVAKPLHDACATLSKDAYPMAYFMNDESQQTSIGVPRHGGCAHRCCFLRPSHCGMPSRRRLRMQAIERKTRNPAFEHDRHAMAAACKRNGGVASCRQTSRLLPRSRPCARAPPRRRQCAVGARRPSHVGGGISCGIS